MAKSNCPGSNPHLGQPNLVKWHNKNIGDSETIKVPFVSKDIEYIRGYNSDGEEASDRWIEKEVWTLSGEIINCESYEKILESQQKLVNKFSEDYKALTVGDLEALVCARVRSIEFGDSQYLDNTPYTIVIEGYRNVRDMASDKKVINPSAVYTWSEADDGTMELTYEVSAQGIVTSNKNNALENAKTFVKSYLRSRDGLNNTESPDFSPTIAFHDINTEGKRFLVKDSETIDRKSGSYGVTRVFKIDQTQGEHSSILRYTVNSEEDYGEDKTVTFDGNIELGYKGTGTPEENLTALRDRYYGFKKSDDIKDPDTEEQLDIVDIISERVQEDELAGLLTFTLVFSEREKGCIDDYGVTVQENAESSIVSVKIDGQVKKPGPCGWEEVLKCFYGDSEPPCEDKPGRVARNYYNKANEWYRQFKRDHPQVGTRIPTSIKLNKNPLEISVSENENEKFINYSVTYDDRESFKAHAVDYTINMVLPVQEIAVASFQQICGGGGHGFGDPDCGEASDPARSHHYQDLGIAARGKFGIKINVKGDADFKEGDAFSFAKNLMQEFTGSGEDNFLSKNSEGGDEKTLVDSRNESYEYEWSWTQKGTDNVVNNGSGNRTLIKKLYFG